MFLNLLIVGSIFQTLHVRGSSSEVLQDSGRIYDAKHKLQPGANYLSISFLKSPISRTTSIGCIFTLMEKRTQWRSRTFPRYRRSWAWNWNLLTVSRLATNQWKVGLWEQRCLIGTLRSDLNKRGVKNNRQEDCKPNFFDNMMICLWMCDVLFWPDYSVTKAQPWHQVVHQGAKPQQQTVSMMEEWKENEFLPQGWRWINQ